MRRVRTGNFTIPGSGFASLERRKGGSMSEAVCGLKLGQKVSDFQLTTYDPITGDFGSFSLQEQTKNKRWTILFFYPADFTFV
jgi:hypothetical protein